MDVLSDTLRTVRLAGAVFFTARFSEPWSVGSANGRELAQLLRLPTDCVTYFHVLVEGGCLVELEDRETFQLVAGDVLIFPRGPAHVMATDLRKIPIPLGDLLPPLSEGRIPDIFTGGAGEVSRFVCGYLYCDQEFNPLLGALPEALVVRQRVPEERLQAPRNQISRNGRVAVIGSGEWLASTLLRTIDEADSAVPGSATMLGRLVEILFVEVLRCYMLALPQNERGWLAGVRDPVVGQALRLLHASPERDWTVEDLARDIAVSRSTLADSFTALIGEPPMRYLTRWRMQLAKDLLRHSTGGIAAVAERVGYASEAAFNRAFKRYTGQPPASWRLQQA
jgi:AraC family transcriptional regulator, alkane utilization regulator